MTYEQRPGPHGPCLFGRCRRHGHGDSPTGRSDRAIGPGIGLASTRDVLTCAWHTDARIEGCTDRTVLAPSMAPLHPPPAPHVARRNGRRDLGDSAAMAPTCFAGMRARAKAKKSPKQRPACWVNLSGIRILHTFILAVHDSFMKNSSATVKL